MKFRTTIYLSEGAKKAIQDNKISLSSFVEECIFDRLGYAKTRAEIESQVKEVSEKLDELNKKLEDYDHEIEVLDKYCKMVSDCMDRLRCDIPKAMEVMSIHRKVYPMAGMSTETLIGCVNKYRGGA